MNVGVRCFGLREMSSRLLRRPSPSYALLLGPNDGPQTHLKATQTWRLSSPIRGIRTGQECSDQGIGPKSTFDEEEARVSTSFTLTENELNFVRYYCYDVYRASDGDREMGPATRWLRDNDIFPTTMQPFQLAAQRTLPDYIAWLSEPPFPPFMPAWSSKEEFEARAWEALEAYPEMKSLGSALPGYRPAHMQNNNLASVSK